MDIHTPDAQIASGPRRRPELVWVGAGGWVVCDPEAAEDDPGRVLGYLECKDSVVYLLCVRRGPEVIEFATLREAVDTVDAMLADDAPRHAAYAAHPAAPDPAPHAGRDSRRDRPNVLTSHEDAHAGGAA